MTDEQKRDFEKMLKEVEERIRGNKTQTELEDEVAFRKKLFGMYVEERVKMEEQTKTPVFTEKRREPRSLRDLARQRGWIE